MTATGRHPDTTLITGGAGFIGSALAWELNRRGQEDLLLADRLASSEKWRHLVPLRFSDYLEADHLLALVERDDERLRGVTTVYHLGACSATTETDASYLIRNNFEYTKTLAEWALRRGIRFVYASSAATYGALESRLSEDLPLAALRPLNMYGYSKHLFDLYAARRGYLDRLVGLKYFNVFGPNEEHKGDMRSMVIKAYEQIRDTGRVRLFKSARPDFEDGEQRRDFLYVKDAVAITAHLGAHPDAHGLFNVGSGEPQTWIALARAVFAALDRPPAIDFIDMPEALRGKYQYATAADITRLRAAGYDAPMTPLAEAISDYVRHYLLPGRPLGDEPAPVRPATTAPVSAS